MRRATTILLVLTIGLVMLPWWQSITGEAAACQFVLGFKDLHDAVPDVVGECLANVHYNPANGDGLQETENGLMVWRKSDNFTAFTDGYRSWVAGPYSVQARLNTDRFEWESNPAAETAPADTPTSGAGQTPAPTENAPVRRLGTGTFFVDHRGNHYSKLTIKNLRSMDAVLTLVPVDSKLPPEFSVYVRGGDTFTVDRVEGKYYVYLMVGEDWDNARRTFTRLAFARRLRDQFLFDVKGDQYVIWTLTLGASSGSNSQADDVDPAQFPGLH